MSTLPKNLYDCLEHPKSCAPDDFWGQVRRTLHGKPVPDEQISMIFAMIRQGLCLQPSDALLDIACGNGRLGSEFFGEITEYLGVDLSPCLIEVGKKNFERQPTHTFILQDIKSYCEQESHPARFTKALCYGAFAYLAEPDARQTLSLLRNRFVGLKALFIGNIPDKDHAHAFFQDREPLPLEDHTTAIGRWRTRAELTELAADCGWKTAIPEMPTAYYQAHYRFNAMLTPKE